MVWLRVLLVATAIATGKTADSDDAAPAADGAVAGELPPDTLPAPKFAAGFAAPAPPRPVPSARGAAPAAQAVVSYSPDMCWFGALQADICCDLRRGQTGEPQCWNGPFNFEQCCPAEAAFMLEELKKSCWYGGVQPNVCCDVRKGVTGDPGCWSDPFTFDLCCPEEAAFVANAPEEGCWTGGISPLACCDVRKGAKGDTKCWDDLFSFDLCCPEEKKAIASAIEDSCWYGALDAAYCCDVNNFGPKGAEICWNDIFNFDSCCTPKTYAGIELRLIQATCWLGEVNAANCCDLRKSAKGDPFCWREDDPHTFDKCCPEEAALGDQFRDSCWLGAQGLEDYCCDPRHGPEGDPQCWGGLFTYGGCCANAV